MGCFQTIGSSEIRVDSHRHGGALPHVNEFCQSAQLECHTALLIAGRESVCSGGDIATFSRLHTGVKNRNFCRC